MSNSFEMQSDELLGKIYDGKLFKRLLRYLKPFLSLIIITFILLIINTLGELCLPLLTQTAIDEHIVPDKKILKLDSEYYQLFTENAEVEKFQVFQTSTQLSTLNSHLYYYIIITSKNQGYIHRDFMQTLKDNDLFSEEKIVILKDSDLSPELMAKIDGHYERLDDHSIYMKLSDTTELLTRNEVVSLRKRSINTVVLIGVLYFAIVLVKFVVNYFQHVLTAIASQKAMHNLRSDLFAHLERMPVKFFDKNPVGRLVTRVTNDIRAIDEMLTSGVITIIQDVFMVVAIMILMLVLNWRLALVSFIVLPFVVYTINIFKNKTRESYREMRKWLAQVNATIAEHISGVKIIQLFNQYRHKTDEFDESNNKYFRASMRQLKLFAIFRPIVGASRQVATALILWYAGGQILENILTIGLFVAFIQYMEKLYEPINNFSEKFNILQGAMAGAERIFDLMDQNQADYFVDKPVVDSISGEIEFKNVWLSYTDPTAEDADAHDSWVLRDISLKIKKGEKIALVGHTGSGKTSIVNLILNMYNYQKGEILIDGKNINEYKLQNLREHIGMVQQDVFLFSGNIRDNITLNNHNLSDEEINKITDYVNVSGFINSLHGKLNEPVQERGATFSVGQRQLIAFARVLAYDPAIFILDEATSNIDTETEILIQDALFKIMENRTSIIIAHRLSTIQHCDRILVLHKGEIVESGSHQELLKNEGLYYNLYRLQYS